MSAGDLFIIVPAVVTAFVICYLSIPVIIRVAEIKNLIDSPDNNRKLHSGIMPTLGGIGIFAAFIISFSVWGQAATLVSYPFFIAALFMLFLVGLRDDILMLDPLKKLIVQVASAVLLVLGGGVIITDLGGLFGFNAIPSFAGVILSVLILVTITNAMNLIDGIDGLAGGIGVIVAGIFGIWFWSAGFISLAILSFTLAGALTGFLVYNMHPARIFMGDTGAMAIGFILGYLTLEFLTLNASLAGGAWHIANAHILAVAILIVPVFDTVRVFLIRLTNGLHPFAADRNHIHHKLIDAGMPAHFASFSLWLANIFVIGVAYSISFMEINMQLAIILALGLAILPALKSIYILSLKVSGETQSIEEKQQEAGSAYHAQS
jgi:UDP-GlcNAc:undecaprenyl-phosphate/decaprenyl-phosphate GlcNAc-1-phosphate transferase